MMFRPTNDLSKEPHAQLYFALQMAVLIRHQPASCQSYKMFQQFQYAKISTVAKKFPRAEESKYISLIPTLHNTQ
jgi:hypothetical protein